MNTPSAWKGCAHDTVLEIHRTRDWSVTDSLLPRGEKLRQALRWIAERGGPTPERIEEASVRFDLSARQEQFLLDHFREEPNSEE